MTALALLLAMSAVPECGNTGPALRVLVLANAYAAYLVSGEPTVRWVAMTGKESSCGTDTTASSSAEGYLQVIARNVPIHKGSALRPLVGWPIVNGLAAGVVARKFYPRCGARWPACYNEGWAGAKAPRGDSFLSTVKRMERQLRAAVRHYGRDGR
jgi:hypothetical protein